MLFNSTCDRSVHKNSHNSQEFIAKNFFKKGSKMYVELNKKECVAMSVSFSPW